MASHGLRGFIGIMRPLAVIDRMTVRLIEFGCNIFARDSAAVAAGAIFRLGGLGQKPFGVSRRVGAVAVVAAVIGNGGIGAVRPRVRAAAVPCGVRYGMI